MAAYKTEKIHSILRKVIGDSKNEGYSSGWRSYNCPYCANEYNMGEPDGKFNMETNVEYGLSFHCWKCERKGKISKIISDFGTLEDLENYRYLAKQIISKPVYHEYKNNTSNTNAETINLPQGFTIFDKNDNNCFKALEYLYSRNIDDNIINKYNIGYIADTYDNDFALRGRIIIPSYNVGGEINYWVGRDYTQKSRLKYKNPSAKKTDVIFNEKFINWYADITLVEGPFDHIVTPNSIPLLGKTIKRGSLLYNSLFAKTQANINIMLDSDAANVSLYLYKLLNHGILKDRIRLIEIGGDYDASSVYETFGKKGIIQLFKRARKIDDYDLQFISR